MSGQLKTHENVPRFWERKTLEEMTPEEWESLCDGCAKCCLCKLEDEKTGEVYCVSYETRNCSITGCAILTPENVRKFHWLPETCAYRRLMLGKDLYRWHRLISGDPDLVHKLGLSVKGKTISEVDIRPSQLPAHVVEWK
jgi:uncharacterized cysteine cluster protein YcgN (CxxCxxCC family)